MKIHSIKKVYVRPVEAPKWLVEIYGDLTIGTRRKGYMNQVVEDWSSVIKLLNNYKGVGDDR